MPVITFESKDKIPEGLQDHANEENGVFLINVVPKAKLDEFRENNISLAEERDRLKSTVDRFSAIGSIEQLEELNTELETLRDLDQKVKDGKLKPGDDFERELENRVRSMRESLEAQLAEAEKRNKEQASQIKAGDERYNSTIIERHVTDAALKEGSGVNTSAIPDILARARSVFKVNENGEVVPMRGDTIIYGEDGATPMTSAEWLGSLKKDAPHFFKDNSGGGAGGSDDTKYPNGMSKEEFNKLPASERLKYANIGTIG